MAPCVRASEERRSPRRGDVNRARHGRLQVGVRPVQMFPPPPCTVAQGPPGSCVILAQARDSLLGSPRGCW